MMIREHGALQAYVKIVLHNLGGAHRAAAGMLGRVTMHFKNHINMRVIGWRSLNLSLGPRIVTLITESVKQILCYKYIIDRMALLSCPDRGEKCPILAVRYPFFLIFSGSFILAFLLLK